MSSTVGGPPHFGANPGCGVGDALSSVLAAVGKICSLSGAVYVNRQHGVTVQAVIGEPLFRSDVIATEADSTVGVVFQDGTSTTLSASTHLVIAEFVSDNDNPAASSVQFDLKQGSFAFVPGVAATTGSFVIDTALATIRSNGRRGGLASMTLAAFTFALIEKLQAATDDVTFLQYDTLSYKDFQHGKFEIRTKEAVPRVFMIDDPQVTFELNGAGSGVVNVQQLQNTPAQMANLIAASQSAATTYSVGLQDPFIRQQQRADVQPPTDTVTGSTRTASASSGSGGLAADPILSAIHASNVVTPSAAISENSNITLATSLAPSASTIAPFPTVIDTFVPTSPFASNGLKLTAPATTFATLEDEPTTINGLVIDGAQGGQATVTLSSSSTLALGSTAGLSFVVGDGVADHTMTFSGSVANLNTALAGLTYTPSEDTVGADQVEFTVTDGVETATGTFTVEIAAVNDPPVLDLLPSSGVQPTATTASFTGGAVTIVPQLTLSDVDSATLAGATVTLTDPQTGDVLLLQGQAGTSGTLVGGITFLISGSTVTFGNVSSLENYKAALQLVQFNNAIVNPSTIDRIFVFQVDDGGGVNNIASATATVTLGAVNHAPVNTVPAATLTVNEDTALAFTGGNTISVHDVDGNLATTQLTVLHGTLVVSLAGGASISSGASGSATLTLSGTETQINAALATLSYQAALNYNGGDALTVLSTDSAGTPLSDSDPVAITVNAVNDAPTITGDFSFAAVKNTPYVLTTADFHAVDPDNSADQLTFTVVADMAGHVVRVEDNLSQTTLTTGSQFTEAQLEAGRILFVPSAAYTGNAGFTVSLSDGVAGSQPAIMTVDSTVFDIQVTTLTSTGLNFQNEDPVATMGAGLVLASHTDTSFTIRNLAANRDFTVTGTGFTYGSGAAGIITLVGGTIASIGVATIDTQQALYILLGSISAADWYNASLAAAQGNQQEIEALSSSWTFTFRGGSGSDAFGAGDGNDHFIGGAGNDEFDGQGGNDLANYGSATGPITVHLAAGTVTGDASVGTDTLRSVEGIRGSNFADTYDATGFSSTSINAGSVSGRNQGGTANDFEGLGGDDLIIGNGSTRVSFIHATAAVTVDIALGSALGDASIGHDTFTGVSSVRGSNFADTLLGSDNTTGTENFEGRGGNDFINGRIGFDRATYSSEDAPITVHLADGTVIGGVNTGTDTLRSIEAITGTEFADIFDATGFTGSGAATPSTNSGNSGAGGTSSNFNEFEGVGGDDVITGNGNTRVAYYNATAGVTVTLTGPATGNGSGAGSSIGTAHHNLLSYANIDPADVGSDTFTGGVIRIAGSEFNDQIIGNVQNNTLDGRSGNDMLDGRGGNDTLTGGTGSDRFTYSTNVGPANGGSGGIDVITDFSQSDFDRIDIGGITGVSNFNALSSLISQSAGNTVITFASTSQAVGTNTLTLQGFTGTLSRSDFIFAGQVAITVQTADGFNFGTLYDDLAGVNPALTTHDASNYILVNSTAGPHSQGLIFDLVNTSGAYTYDQAGNYVSGAVNSIIIYDTFFNVLTTSEGWSNISSVTSLLNAASSYAADHTNTAGFDAIFGGASYSAAGDFSASFDNNSVNGGGDTFFSGFGNDVFNGLTNANGGDFDYGDTVDYSHVASAVIANLAAAPGAQTSGGGGNDILLNIEDLRGSAFNDTLTGDGNSNTLEGGVGNDVLDGGVGGIDTASYEHATSGVTVNLTTTTQQDTVGAGLDTLTNFEALRGSAFDDILTGNGSSTLEGGNGNDHLIGQANGSDTASYQHSTAGVNVNLALIGPQDTGSAGFDTLTNIKNLTGSNFSDHLIGDGNNNVLYGGFGGTDVLTGGGGADTFQFGSGKVTITDFSTAQGDKIELFLTLGATHDAAVTALDALIASTTGDTFNFSNGGALTLTNVDVHSLHTSDFILHP
jgi:Ca2+-binding RTX toxin-like protein